MKKTFCSVTHIQKYVYILGMPPEATVCSRPHKEHSVSSWFLNDLWMWPSGGCQRWRPPEWRGPDGRGYKYTSCLSGTAKCFYSLTEARVRAPSMASLNVPVYIKTLAATPEYASGPCSPPMPDLCLLCFRRVGRLLMPGDMHKGSRHKWVSSRLAHNGRRNCNAAGGHGCFLWHKHMQSLLFRGDTGLKVMRKTSKALEGAEP